MEDLQLVLFVLGAIAIVAVLVHGFWSIRKQQPRPIKERPRAQNMSDAQRRDSQGFDADGIGAVRVRKPGANDLPNSRNHTSVPVMTLQKTSASDEGMVSSHGYSPERNERLGTERTTTERAETADTERAVMSAQPVTPQQETYGVQGAGAEVKVSVEPQGITPSQHVNLAPPKYEAATQPSPSPASPVQSQAPREPEPLGEPQDVLVLHVVAHEGQEIQGAELLPCLLSLNFKFGDMNIFHRHSDNAGNGKVLFSLANMMKPGVFDPDNMEQFCTQGIVMFMTLPCHGEAQHNFSIMLNSAEQLADDLGAIVLDEQRKVWTEHNKQDYLRRIKAIV
jgi:cell division protein ZipA